MNKIAKYIAIAFAVIMVVLLGILIFVNPPKKDGTMPTSPDGRVRIANIFSDQVIISPVSVNGSVTGGGWFFEATFPIKIMDADGTVLGQGQARAEGDWMSTGTVPFSAAISFSAPHFTTGTILFTKDNPSGLPGNSEFFSIPVRFR